MRVGWRRLHVISAAICAWGCVSAIATGEPWWVAAVLGAASLVLVWAYVAEEAR